MMANDEKGLTKLGMALPPETVEALRQGGQQIDVNVLLVQVVKNTHDPQEVVRATEQMLKLTRDFESQRVDDFKKRADAMIDVKLRDPDECEKRANNRVRRYLKVLIALLGVGQVGGGFACALVGAGIVATGLLLLGGIFCVALLGMLASGESISSNDVVKVLGAVRGLNGGSQEQQQNRKGKR